MKEASSWRAEDVRVRECFFVNVRKASGRRVGGGRMIGRIAAFGALMLKGLRGWMGVPKAGEEDGRAEEGIGLFFRKMGAGVRSMIAALRIDKLAVDLHCPLCRELLSVGGRRCLMVGARLGRR